LFFDKVYAFDISEIRRKAAEKHGAIALPLDKLRDQVLLETNGRGADAILEIVGHPSAMQTAMRLVRPCGIISSCGMHTHSVVLNGPALFNKKWVTSIRYLGVALLKKYASIRFQFGRCSVATYFKEALEVLRTHKDLFSTFIQHIVSLEEAPTYYHYFEQGKIGKVIFKLDKE
jgi:threonine dehydrogenase-like Zn-dependent dehydrogenase